MTNVSVTPRYLVHGAIGRGGTATVHLGTLAGAGGSARTVAIKKLREGLAKNEQLIASLIDEARITSQIRHPNVVSTIEVVASAGELYVVMEYVEGDTLAAVLGTYASRGERIPVPIVAALMIGALRGLHAAHEACDPGGAPLAIIHRDVSPQNIMVGTDGRAHVVDFGIARAVGRVAQTRQGEIKGKLAYMPPEQLHGETLDRRVDVYSAGVVLWEALTSARLFRGKDDAETIDWIRAGRVPPPSSRAPGVASALDAVVRVAVARTREQRFPTAEAMARALEAATPVASLEEVAAWARRETADLLTERRRELAVASTNPAMATLRASGARPTPTPAPAKAERTPAPRGRTAPRGSALATAILILGLLLLAVACAGALFVFRGSRRDPLHHPAIPEITPSGAPARTAP